MLTVAINSATQQISVALLKNGKLVAEKSWNSKKDEAEKLLPNIAALLKKNKRRWRDIEEVFVVSGPGPFTGLRIGVTVANTLAWSTQSHIKKVNVFEYLQERITPKLRQKTAVIVKAGGDFVALLKPGSQKEQLIEIAKLPAIFKKTNIRYVLAEMKTSDIIALKKLLKSQKISVKFLTGKELTTFGQTISALLKRAKKGSRIPERGQKLVKPLYLQKPHITQSKKQIFV